MSLTPSRSASVRAPNVRNHQLRTSPGLLVAPLIICFHGSGSDPLPSWDNLIATLVKSYRVLLLDRGSENPTPEEDFPVMLDYLRLHELNPPYVLVAHSYGGAFAKLFLHRRLKDVAGLVLVETGQEGGLSVEVRQFLNKRYALGDCPIVVIRGNSLIKHWKDLRVSEVAAESQEEKQRLREQRAWLEAADREDEKLKKSQLALSKNAKYVYLPDCGHGVVRESPEVVVEAVNWIMEQPTFTSTSKKSRSTVPFWKTWWDFLW